MAARQHCQEAHRSTEEPAEIYACTTRQRYRHVTTIYCILCMSVVNRGRIKKNLFFPKKPFEPGKNLLSPMPWRMWTNSAILVEQRLKSY